MIELCLYISYFVDEVIMENIKNLISRNTPEIVDSFIFEKIEKENGFDVCEYTKKDGKILLKGNNTVSLAHAYWSYLKKYCNAYLAHCSELELKIKDAPLPCDNFKKVIKQDKRVYLDYITASNSTWLWDWQRWEKELDIMAMNGINMALNVVGNDAILFNALVKSGMSERSAGYYVSGPAFFAWQMTGKIDMFLPRNDYGKYDEELVLAKKIFNRMKELDIEPILSTYNGQLSKGILKLFGRTKNYKIQKWSAFPSTFKIDISDKGFKKIFKEYMFFQEENIGTANYYMCNQLCNFDEKKGKEKYLKKNAEELERLLNFCVDSEKPCLVFPSEGYDKYFLDGIKNCDKLVFDIDGSMHDKTNYFDNNDFVIGNSHNNSPHISLRGDIEGLSKNEYIDLINEHKNVRGVGFFPESIEQNPVYQEMMFEIMTSDKQLDTENWIKSYVSRRYGEDNADIYNAYKILLDTCYSTNNSQTDVGSTMCTRPTPEIRHTSLYDRIAPAYDNKKLLKCCQLLLNSNNKTYNMNYTILFVVRQLLDNYAYSLYKKIMQNYFERDKESYEKNVSDFLAIFDDVNELLCSFDETNALSIFTKIKNSSKDNEEEISNTLNYLVSHTIWGPMTLESERYDYGWICISELFEQYYKVRWDKFFQNLSHYFGKNNIQIKTPMQINDRDHYSHFPFYENMAQYEKKVVLEFVPKIPVSKNTFDIVKNILEKYSDKINLQ